MAEKGKVENHHKFTDHAEIVELPSGYQKEGLEEEDDDFDPTNIDMDKVEVATVEDILGMSSNLPREWVYLPALKRRVMVEALTDEERQLINKRAKKKFDKRTKKMETNPDSVLYELIKLKVINPVFPTVDIISKLPSGDLTQIVRAINKLSGLTNMDYNDALG